MKKNLFFTLICTLFFVVNFHTKAEKSIQKETFTYAIKDADTLRLDKYDKPSNEVKPCVIFVFGGGFFTGKRDNNFYTPYYQFLANNGYTVVAIDYRLGLKNIKDEKNLTNKKFLSIFEKTIFMAVEDLFDATNYVLENSDSWKINKDIIVISGSSAGGITVLQGEYERSNRTEVAERLPKNFKYAGVIAFAGAIYSNKGHLKWSSTPAPAMLFHGDADKNVPFNKIKLGRLGFFGSNYIAQKYTQNKVPYHFYVEENEDHILASSPMIFNQDEIKNFLERYVIQKQRLHIKTTVKSIDKPKVRRKFKIKEYVKANFE